MINNTRPRTFLGGGGNELETVELDTRFVATLVPGRQLVYVPVAAEDHKYQACQRWFTDAFGRLGVTNIVVLTNVRQTIPVDQVAGVYMGGGNTVKLLREIRAAGFDQMLLECHRKGIPIYGGSAGAIVLGKDIRTAPEAAHLSVPEAAGMDFLAGHVVQCHVQSFDAAQKMHHHLGYPTIALTEKAGAQIQGHELEALGTAPAWLLDNQESIQVNTGEKYTLL